jgi:hypothetical protein
MGAPHRKRRLYRNTETVVPSGSIECLFEVCAREVGATSGNDVFVAGYDYLDVQQRLRGVRGLVGYQLVRERINIAND